MVKSKRVTCYDMKGIERKVMPHEYDRLKKAGVVTDKPPKKEKEEKSERVTKENKTAKATK